MVDEQEKPKKPIITDETFQMMTGWLVIIAFLALFFWWLIWWDHPRIFSDKIIAYPLICSKGFRDTPGAVCRGNATLDHPISYRVSKERAEVVVMTKKGTPPKTLTRCSIFDNENWKCTSPDGSGKVFFVDGLQKSKDPKIRYISQWQYRLSELLELF